MSRRGRITVRRILILGAVTAVSILGITLALRNRPVILRGAVLRKSDDLNKESPVAGVKIQASDGFTSVSAVSNVSGGFELTLRRALILRHKLTLSFRHPSYTPYDVVDPVGDQLYIARMTPLPEQTPAPENPETVKIANVSVRYTVKTEATVDVGSGVKTFDVANKGNVACKRGELCSPDRRWKASTVTATLDAGNDNEFRNGRVSCIAGPCPFTSISRDGYSHGGRTISVTVLGWSDTTTFLLQAEAIRRTRSESVRKSYPVIFDRTMNFSLPDSAEGTCLQAEIDGVPVVFPIDPNLSLSWTQCTTEVEGGNTKLYRCELKPGYAFK